MFKQSFIFQSTVKLFVLTIFVAGLVEVSAEANTKGGFKKHHPRRAEVNKRVRNQERRINRGEKSGKLTHEQADQMRSDVHEIKAKERAAVKAHGGHLTKPEQKELNKELNVESKKIYQEKHPEAPSVPAVPAP